MPRPLLPPTRMTLSSRPKKLRNIAKGIGTHFDPRALGFAPSASKSQDFPKNAVIFRC